MHDFNEDEIRRLAQWLGRDPDRWLSLMRADIEREPSLAPMLRARIKDLLEVLDVKEGKRDVEPIVEFSEGYTREPPDAEKPSEGTDRQGGEDVEPL
jgi:hypothetical protein